MTAKTINGVYQKKSVDLRVPKIYLASMFEKTNVVELFPTHIWVHDLERSKAASICEKVFAQVEKRMPPVDEISGGHSVQSGTQMQNDPAFGDLMECVDKAAQDVLSFLGKKGESLQVTGCWANVSGPNSHHREHSHPNNFLSGVFYVKTPKGGDTINFHDPRPAAHAIAPHFERPSMHNLSTMFVEAKPGRIMIFPSWLRHSVDPNSGEGLRVSVAFNLMFGRYSERHSRPKFSGAF
ncbi:MAG: 2OG-Fe(II) oxygenase family protein [Rhodospirillaceae bacterium]|jgi:uncharacterized protein (TIGR02466 family)